MLVEVVSDKPRVARLSEYTDGIVPDDQVRVKTYYAAAKHGTEFTHFNGYDPFLENDFDEEYLLFCKNEDKNSKPFFMQPGNMFVGEIVEKGDAAKELETGQRVAGYGPIHSTHTCGTDNILVMPERMTWKEAVCYDPAHFALGGIRDGKVRMGDVVAVFGLGAIGLIAIQMAKQSGASCIIAIDPIAKRREIASQTGADICLDPTTCDSGFEMKKATNKRGVDVAIEASGSYAALQDAIRGIAYEGNIAVAGWYKPCKGLFNLGREAHFNQPNIIFSRACSESNRDYPRWDFKRITGCCWDMLAKGMFDCEAIVDPVVPVESAAETYMQINENPSLSVKMGVSFKNVL